MLTRSWLTEAQAEDLLEKIQSECLLGLIVGGEGDGGGRGRFE